MSKINQTASSVMEILQLLSTEYERQANQNLSYNISNTVALQTS